MTLKRCLIWSIGWSTMLPNVPPLLVSCKVRNFLFSVKDKNSCETRKRTYHKIRNCEQRLLADRAFTFFRKFINSEYYILFSFQKD